MQGKPPITERLSRLPHRDKLFAQTSLPPPGEGNQCVKNQRYNVLLWRYFAPPLLDRGQRKDE